MTVSVKLLFEPFQYGPLHLPSRIVMAPMTRSFSPHGIPGDNVVEYYRRRAAAGVGLIITEGTLVNHPVANANPNVPFFYGENPLAAWKKVVDAVHKEGGRIAPQLWHVGEVRRIGTEPNGNMPSCGPRERVSNGKVVVKAMTQEDIDNMVAAFAQAAKDAKDMGMDGVEIHGAHGYLIDQFFWTGTNTRTDAYGGSLENRLRFAIEIIGAVRKAVGPDFPVILRYSQWKQQDYGARLAETPQQLEAFLAPLVEAGVDIFDCSTRRFWEPEFDGSTLNLAGWTRKITGKPTITVGSVGLDGGEFLQFLAGKTDQIAIPSGVEAVVERLKNQEFDLVAVGRALLVDPDWAAKIRDQRINDLKPFSRDALMTLV